MTAAQVEKRFFTDYFTTWLSFLLGDEEQFCYCTICHFRTIVILLLFVMLLWVMSTMYSMFCLTQFIQKQSLLKSFREHFWKRRESKIVRAGLEG